MPTRRDIPPAGRETGRSSLICWRRSCTAGTGMPPFRTLRNHRTVLHRIRTPQNAPPTVLRTVTRPPMTRQLTQPQCVPRTILISRRRPPRRSASWAGHCGTPRRVRADTSQSISDGGSSAVADRSTNGPKPCLTWQWKMQRRRANANRPAAGTTCSRPRRESSDSGRHTHRANRHTYQDIAWLNAEYLAKPGQRFIVNPGGAVTPERVRRSVGKASLTGKLVNRRPALLLGQLTHPVHNDI